MPGYGEADYTLLLSIVLSTQLKKKQESGLRQDESRLVILDN
jgi:hypothetical protein